MQKTYYNKGEANAILSGIASWRNKGIYGRCICGGSFPSNTTLERIKVFVDTVLSAEDREAVRLSDTDKKAFYVVCSKFGRCRQKSRVSKSS
nr:hypothetical protein [uncultured Campylobacter sp.]